MRLPAGAIFVALAVVFNTGQAVAASPTPAPQYTPEEAHAG
jgi:hypothetical protein